MAKSKKNLLLAAECKELFNILKIRFEKNSNRHKGLDWAAIQAKLEADKEKSWSLNEMERTSGEPDVIGYDKKTGEYIFYHYQPTKIRNLIFFV